MCSDKRILKKTLQQTGMLPLLGLIVLMFLFPLNALAWGIVYDPSDVYQNTITAVETAKSLEQSVQQTASQLQMVQQLVQNSKNYSSGDWENTEQALEALANEVQQGQALSYNMQNLDAAFQQKFPGYQAPQDYDSSYQSWSTTTMDTIRGVLDSLNMQSTDFNSESSLLNQLDNFSQSASGRMQALQAGNMIASQMVSQTQKLRQVVMAQTNAQATYMAYQVQTQQAQQASMSQWIESADTTFPSYQDDGFGANNFPSP